MSSLSRPVLAFTLLVVSLSGAAPAIATGCAVHSVTPSALSWRRWHSGTEAVAYEWLGSGLAVVSDDCASRLDMKVEITDRAPHGNPPVVTGFAGHGYNDSGADGEFRAYAQAETFVLYYDWLNLYVRGSSVVELKVTATYYDPVLQATVPLGCVVTYTKVTPLPTEPLLETGPVQDCG